MHTNMPRFSWWPMVKKLESAERADHLSIKGMPQLSVLIPWRDRPEIRTTLEQNIAILRQFDSEILILNCGGDAERLKTLLRDSKISSPPEIHITDLVHTHFNKSYALNIGAYLSRSSRIFVLDADILLNVELIRDALDILERSAFATVEKVFESQPIDYLFEGSKYKPLSVARTHFIDISLADGNTVKICSYRSDASGGSRAGPGLVFVRREDLLRIEGYNADLLYWGWEDLD